jgi:hypothetical protein
VKIRVWVFKIVFLWIGLLVVPHIIESLKSATSPLGFDDFTLVNFWIYPKNLSMWNLGLNYGGFGSERRTELLRFVFSENSPRNYKRRCYFFMKSLTSFFVTSRYFCYTIRYIKIISVGVILNLRSLGIKIEKLLNWVSWNPWREQWESVSEF